MVQTEDRLTETPTEILMRILIVGVVGDPEQATIHCTPTNLTAILVVIVAEAVADPTLHVLFKEEELL